MKVLVTYGTRHGATRGIAERIASTLGERNLDVTVQPVEEAGEVDEYDAFVIGSAAYNTHWLKEATNFVHRHRTVLANRPVWVFSSGPIGSETVDAKGCDVIEASEPAEFADLAAEIRPRDLRVFFGAYDPDAPPVGFAERLGSVFTRMPSIRAAVPAGDFRDWPAIEAWAADIGRELAEIGVPTAVLA